MLFVPPWSSSTWLKVASTVRRNGEVTPFLFSPANLCVKWLLLSLSFRVNYELLTNCKGELIYMFYGVDMFDQHNFARGEGASPFQKPLPPKKNKTKQTKTHQLPSKLKMFFLRGVPLGHEEFSGSQGVTTSMGGWLVQDAHKSWAMRKHWGTLTLCDFQGSPIMGPLTTYP